MGFLMNLDFSPAFSARERKRTGIDKHQMAIYICQVTSNPIPSPGLKIGNDVTSRFMINYVGSVLILGGKLNKKSKNVVPIMPIFNRNKIWSIVTITIKFHAVK